VETETFCPPLDLYLNKRVRAFEERLARSPAAAFVRGTPAWVAAELRGRRGGRQLQPSPVSGRAKAEWAERWAPKEDIPIPHGEAREPTPGEKERWLEEATRREWIARWHVRVAEAMRKRKKLSAAEARARFDGTTLQYHTWPSTDEKSSPHYLSKAMSSLLVQIRTGKIGLRAFLFERRVPEVTTPYCRCGLAKETFEHIVLECRETEDTWLWGDPTWPTNIEQLHDELETVAGAERIVRWALRLGRLQEYKLAVKIEQAREAEELLGKSD
jgi:hypothetical protein